MLYQTMWWKLENPFLTPYLPTTPQSVGKPHIWGNVHALLRVTFFTLLAPHWNLECYWKNNLICFQTSQIIKLFQISLFVKFYISRPFNSCKYVLPLSSHVFVVSVLHDFTSIRLFFHIICLSWGFKCIKFQQISLSLYQEFGSRCMSIERKLFGQSALLNYAIYILFFLRLSKNS